MGASTSPNIVNVTSMHGTTVGFALSTTVTTDLITVSANKILRLTALRATNVDGTNDATVTVGIVFADADPNGISDFDVTAINPLLLAKTINVPAGSALDLIDRGAIYLRAGDVLEGGASSAGDIQLAVSYEVLDDA